MDAGQQNDFLIFLFFTAVKFKNSLYLEYDASSDSNFFTAVSMQHWSQNVRKQLRSQAASYRRKRKPQTYEHCKEAKPTANATSSYVKLKNILYK